METSVRAVNRERRAPTGGHSSPVARAQELAMEAQALLARHARETAELRIRLRHETATLGDRRAVA